MRFEYLMIVIAIYMNINHQKTEVYGARMKTHRNNELALVEENTSKK
ncbi:MAG: hypothetical protein M3297_04230 [Thermoproteota archaeon]|nr:hypothetical protein [Thermoproteota archaeon]